MYLTVWLLLLSLFVSGCSSNLNDREKIGLQDNAKCIVQDVDTRGTYEGGCLNGFAHGKGFARGRDTYQGDFAHGKKSGFGVYRWGQKSDWAGERYEGSWENDDRKGFGTYFDIKNGLISATHGIWNQNSIVYECGTDSESECFEEFRTAQSLKINWLEANWTIQSSTLVGYNTLKCGPLDATFTVAASPGFSAQLTSTDVYFYHKSGEVEGREVVDQRGEATFVSDRQSLTFQVRRFTCSTSWGTPVLVAKLEFTDVENRTQKVRSTTTFSQR